LALKEVTRQSLAKTIKAIILNNHIRKSLIACLFLTLPTTVAAQFFSGLAEAMKDNAASSERRADRAHQRELLEMQLQHQRDMLDLQKEQQVQSQVRSGNLRVLPEIDFYGADIVPNGIRGVSLDTCVQICAENKVCVAVSWVNERSWCFPKHGSGYQKRLNQDVTSVQVR
jgi:hypothetical protein